MNEEGRLGEGAPRKCIGVIGNWHNAFVTAAGLAELGHEVVLVNPDVKKPWTAFPTLDIHEPGLDESLRAARERGRLSFANIQSSAHAQNLSGAPYLDEASPPSILWLAIDTPLMDDSSPDVAPLYAALEGALRGPCAGCGRMTSGVRCHQCAPESIPRARLVVIGSQVPVGFCQTLEKRVDMSVACVPENYQLGKAMGIFRDHDRLVIGATTEETRRQVRALFAPDPITGSPTHRTVMCDLPTAEMIKHATNAFLATSISFANEIARVAEGVGADAAAIGRALRMDARIGSRAYVMPGLGFAGGTLVRDLRALQLAARAGSRPLVDAVLMVNDSVVESLAQNIAEMKPNQVVILGYTYKADTDALRCSPARQIADALRPKYDAYGFDPRMNEKTAQDLALAGIYPDHHLKNLPLHVGSGTVVYVVVTPLPEFKKISWLGLMPGTVYDLSGGVDKEAVLAAGLSYKAIWQPMEKR